MKFDRVAFWIQILNVLLLCMTKDIGEYLGGLIREVQDVDLGASGDCLGKFLATSSSSVGSEFGLWLKATSQSRSIGAGFHLEMPPGACQNSGREAGGASASGSRGLHGNVRSVSPSVGGAVTHIGDSPASGPKPSNTKPPGEVGAAMQSVVAGVDTIRSSALQVEGAATQSEVTGLDANRLSVLQVVGAVRHCDVASLDANRGSVLQAQTLDLSGVIGDNCGDSVAGVRRVWFCVTWSWLMRWVRVVLLRTIALFLCLVRWW
ncbi:hypothetical protein ACOSQ4_032203 [Xanthoceras sorbifolium]